MNGGRWRRRVIVDGPDNEKGRGWPVCRPFVPSQRAMSKKLSRACKQRGGISTIAMRAAV